MCRDGAVSPVFWFTLINVDSIKAVLIQSPNIFFIPHPCFISENVGWKWVLLATLRVCEMSKDIFTQHASLYTIELRASFSTHCTQMTLQPQQFHTRKTLYFKKKGRPICRILTYSCVKFPIFQKQIYIFKIDCKSISIQANSIACKCKVGGLSFCRINDCPNHANTPVLLQFYEMFPFSSPLPLASTLGSFAQRSEKWKPYVC